MWTMIESDVHVHGSIHVRPPNLKHLPTPMIYIYICIYIYIYICMYMQLTAHSMHKIPELEVRNQ